jgi:hypothetical protein
MERFYHRVGGQTPRATSTVSVTAAAAARVRAYNAPDGARALHECPLELPAAGAIGAGTLIVLAGTRTKKSSGVASAAVSVGSGGGVAGAVTITW